MITNSTENYLRAISALAGENGYAYTTDIAKELGVKSPSVTNMLQELGKKGLIIYKKYSGARLTDEGAKIARKTAEYHAVFKKFLKKISVPERLAQKDAWVMEHGLSSSTLRQMSKFVQFAEKFGENPCFFALFEDYCKSGKIIGCSAIQRRK